jgi:hypothetical protein
MITEVLNRRRGDASTMPDVRHRAANQRGSDLTIFTGRDQPIIASRNIGRRWCDSAGSNHPWFQGAASLRRDFACPYSLSPQPVWQSLSVAVGKSADSMPAATPKQLSAIQQGRGFLSLSHTVRLFGLPNVFFSQHVLTIKEGRKALLPRAAELFYTVQTVNCGQDCRAPID